MAATTSRRKLILALTIGAALQLAGCAGGAPGLAPVPPTSEATNAPAIATPSATPTTAPSDPTPVPQASTVEAPKSPVPVDSTSPAAITADPSIPAPSRPAGSSKPRPSFDPGELAAFLNAKISVLNVADQDMTVTLGYIDAKTKKLTDLGTYPVGALEQLTQPVAAGKYQFDFRLPAGSSSGPRCTITIADKAAVRFVAASADAIAVVRTGATPKSGADLLVARASICKA